MTSRERVFAASRRDPTDRLPVGLYMANHSTVAVGGRLDECCTNARALADAQLRAYEAYGQDVVIAQCDNYYMAEAFGCVAEFYADTPPELVRPAFRNVSDAASVKPVDPLSDGRMHVYLDAIRILSERLGEEAAIRGCGTGPFVLCGHLFGVENFIMQIADAFYGDTECEERVNDLLEVGRETLRRFVALQLEAGASIVQCADSTASLDMISPEMYRRYVYPVERRFFTDIGPLCDRYRAAGLLHICGDTTEILPDMADTGAHILEIDHKLDLAHAKRAVGDRVCLLGNLNPAGELLHGDPEAVDRAVVTCIEDAGHGGGFILGSGCEVPINAPVENVKRAIETGKTTRLPTDRTRTDRRRTE